MRRRMTEEQKRQAAIQRFWRNTKVSDGCWSWRGRKLQGYGRISVNRACINAHMFSYLIHHEMSVEDIPMDPTRPGFRMSILHSCPNRDCCNPDHLRLGTHKENIDDREAWGNTKRGRTWKLIDGRRVWSKRHAA